MDNAQNEESDNRNVDSVSSDKDAVDDTGTMNMTATRTAKTLIRIQTTTRTTTNRVMMTRSMMIPTMIPTEKDWRTIMVILTNNRGTAMNVPSIAAVMMIEMIMMASMIATTM